MDVAPSLLCVVSFARHKTWNSKGGPAQTFEEKEFFIRKVIGWVLRELSKHDPMLAEIIIDEFRDRASGLTLREATKYL